MRLMWFFVLRQSFALASLGFVLVFYCATREMKARVTAFPHLFVVLAAFFFGWVIVTETARYLGRKGAEREISFDLKSAWQPLAVAGGILAYIVLMAVLGFLTATGLFLVGMMLLLGERNPLVLALVTIGSVVVCWLVFRQWLHVPFPEGLLG